MKFLVENNLAMVSGGQTQCSSQGGSNGGSAGCRTTIYKDKKKEIYFDAGASVDGRGRVQDKRVGLGIKIPFK